MLRLDFLLALLVMAVVTYLTRLLPMLFFRREITNKRVRSFLYYVPYVVLAAMTFPTVIISATEHIITGVVLTIVCITLAYFKRGLITVAFGGALSILICELIITLI